MPPISDNKSVMLLIGAPGAGKGTLAKSLNDEGWYPYSTGEALRSILATARSEGRSAEIDSAFVGGSLVSDDYVNKLIEKNFKENGDRPRILYDGYPRTAEQSKFVLETIGGRAKIIVLFLEANKDICWKRVQGRALESELAEQTHQMDASSDPCINEKKGDKKREDDNFAAFQKRWTVYEDTKEAVCSALKDSDLIHGVHIINAEGGKDEVAAKAKNALQHSMKVPTPAETP